MSSDPLFRTATVTGTQAAEIAESVAATLVPRKPGTLRNALGFVYVTEALAGDLKTVLEVLRDRTGVPHWTGCVGAGVCGTGVEHHSGKAVSAMIADLPPDSFHMLDSVRQPEDVDDEAIEGWEDTARPLLGVVHGDPRNAAVMEIISLLPEAIECYLVGGLTASPGGPAQIADGVTGGGLSGVLFSATVPVAVGLSQGCQPMGPPRQITGMDGDWVAALDGRPAVEALKEDLGPEDFANLRHLGGIIHAALPVESSDTAEYTVRNLVAVDPHTGRIGISADLIEGERLMFVRRDPKTAEDDLRRMVRRLRKRARGTPRGGLYISCLARGPNMFGTETTEMGIVAEELGPVPLTGFFANGEINNNRLYAYTGVLTLFL